MYVGNAIQQVLIVYQLQDIILIDIDLNKQILCSPLLTIYTIKREKC